MRRLCVVVVVVIVPAFLWNLVLDRRDPGSTLFSARMSPLSAGNRRIASSAINRRQPRTTCSSPTATSVLQSSENLK